MCGICGLIRSPSNIDTAMHSIDEALDQMISSIAHRGPDNMDKYLSADDTVGLGHCRLSIIDLSSAGNQPIRNEDGTMWIVFNGEIYNYEEIRPRLREKGHVFQSHSDTEVVLHAYEEWGVNCLEQFRGFWAFAIWDENHRQLFLARDRIGKKPLYYCQKNDTLYFSSELKSLVKIRNLQLIPSPQAIHHYLSYYAIPAPDTIWKRVRSLEAGSFILYRYGSIQKHRYWDIPVYNPTKWDKNSIIDEVRRLLTESVRYRLVSDVPVGAFLSGGIDSTLIVALMNRLTSEPIQTFSVGFGSEGESIDERSCARKTAGCLNTRHTEIIMSGRDVRDDIENIVWGIDQPSGDGINTYLVAKAAAKSVRVVVSGIGGDELFLGYRPLIRMKRLAHIIRFWRCLPGDLRSTLSNLSKEKKFRLLPGNRYLQRALELFENPTLMRMRRDETEKNELYTPEFCRALNSHEKSEEVIERWLSGLDEETIVKLTRLDLKHYLHSTLLRDFDVMTMIHSLEGRAPFLDHELIEFAYNIPPVMKFRNGVSKYVLLEAFNDVLPEHVKEQPKRGFEIPMNQWLRTDLKDIVADTLSHSCVKSRGIFDWSAVSTLIKDWHANRIQYMDIWSLVMLELWFRRFSPSTSFR